MGPFKYNGPQTSLACSFSLPLPKPGSKADTRSGTRVYSDQNMTCLQDPATLRSPSKCAIISQLLSAITAARRGSHGISPGEGPGEAISVAQTVSAFLQCGVQACQPVPQPGAHTNALCDLAQQAAHLACELQKDDAASRGDVSVILGELVAAVQLLKGMRRNALLRRIQALQSSTG